MANDYIVNKWRMWFRFIDINRRGEISKADVRDQDETFARLSHLDAEKKKSIQENLDKLWNDIVFRGKSGAIKEDEFVAMNIQHYSADKAKFQDEMRKAFTALYSDIVDVCQKGSVSEEEFVNIMRSIGHENIALDKKVFHLYNPVGGKVPLQVLIDSWVQFTSCDDSSKRDIAKEGIESGV